MTKVLTAGKKSTIKNLTHGWEEVQANPKNCPVELSGVTDMLTCVLEDKYHPCGGWETTVPNTFLKRFTDAFGNNWSTWIDLTPRTKSIISIIVSNGDSWREILCVGNYHAYEVKVKVYSK
jgi:hypothetical protein